MNYQLRLVFALTAVFVLTDASPVLGQDGIGTSIDRLRHHLYVISHDSMGGRSTGSRGNYLTTEYLAARFAEIGLEPAGEDGTFFQALLFVETTLQSNAFILSDGDTVRVGSGVAPVRARIDWDATGARAVFGGALADTSHWKIEEEWRGTFVVFSSGDLPWREAYSMLGTAAAHLEDAGASAVGLIIDGQVLDFFEGRALRPSRSLNGRPDGTPQLLLSESAAAVLFQSPTDGMERGVMGPPLEGGYRYDRAQPSWAARNVVAVLRGLDPEVNHTYVAVTAHNDHVGTTSDPVDHDSLFAHNRVVRPMGADSRNREATEEEAIRIQSIRDSLAALRPSPLDSVYNGADDDGSGTVALIEIARMLAAGERPRRSVLFVSHAAEEIGLVGSEWFTDHPLVPRDSIIGEIDLDMVGRGPGTADPEYLEVIGTRRLSTEFGDILEEVNAGMERPFTFNYEYDAPGHPLRYYCRVDAYSYARYGIPVASLSRGSHPDYHQLTDEPQYIDYQSLARVVTLVRDFALALGNRDERPYVDGPVSGPDGRCVQ